MKECQKKIYLLSMVIKEQISMRKLSFLFITLLTIINATSIEFGNRISGYVEINENYQKLGADWALSIDEEIEYKGYLLSGNYSLYSKFTNIWLEGVSQDYDMESYRYFLRISKPQTELRIGLQRLSFGTAKILRPLQWFDQVDPIDAYQVTQGVKAVLVRHHWLNNSNIWLWGILGSDQLKGNEIIKGVKNSLEWGGRFQYPTLLGDLGLTFHTRELNTGNEYRYGLDLRTDGVIGAWLESSLSYKTHTLPLANYLLLSTIGLDYVFELGNGLAVTFENMLITEAEDRIRELTYEDLASAILVSYPWGILDSFQVLASRSHASKDYSISGLWRRVYDYYALDFTLTESKHNGFSIHLMMTIDF